jgi:hypothetical protein
LHIYCRIFKLCVFSKKSESSRVIDMVTKVKLLILISFFFFSVNQVDASSLHDEKTSYCKYLAPIQPVKTEEFFHELISRGNSEKETFDTIASYLKEQAAFCHRFEFKYPLKNKEYAQVFTKVLHIKAQQAHRFVPVIAFCEFIAPSHLGFIRKYNVQGLGSSVQEHVLIDQTDDNIIFIEEFIEDIDSGVQLGCFAAINSILEEEGCWYFAGTCLYDWEPEAETINKTIQMFRKTYENMIFFIENEDIDAVYNQLSDY